jgi:hypothetical protein
VAITKGGVKSVLHDLGKATVSNVFRDGILKLLSSPGIDSKESIPLVYVARLAGTKTLFLLGS